MASFGASLRPRTSQLQIRFAGRLKLDAGASETRCISVARSGLSAIMPKTLMQSAWDDQRAA